MLRVIKQNIFERKEYKLNWGGIKWLIMHYHFHVANNNNEMPWLQTIEDLSSSDEDGVDGGELGHEDLIVGLHDYGNQMQPNGRSEWEIGMINGDRNLKYSDVIPEYYMKHLLECRSLW
ncbi:CRL_G0038570.mRNA.1.CDS.1 [Saccharomyces cerevisiae]|nr:CRL_G0038570.mRNA.1.CDS.1 [Saccharomyces cerevisiae]CAI7415177.1 CRL_G0038570.mRNA.1.CDS.1 [Saccharomyces cerevisiae]